MLPGGRRTRKGAFSVVDAITVLRTKSSAHAKCSQNAVASTKAHQLTAVCLLLIYICTQLGPLRRIVGFQVDLAEHHDARQHNGPSLIALDQLINYILAPPRSADERANEAC